MKKTTEISTTPYITTISLNTKINSKINLGLLYHFTLPLIKPGFFIIGMKMENKFIGVCNEKKKAFCNQATFTLKYNNNKLSMKLFPNGKIQLSGCKKEEDCSIVCNIMLEYLKTVCGTYKIDKQLLTFKHNLLVDNTTSFSLIIGFNDKYFVSGFIKPDAKIQMNAILVSFNPDNEYYYYLNNRINKTSTIFNNTCQKIGTSQVILRRGRKHNSRYFKKQLIVNTRTKKIYHLMDTRQKEEIMGKIVEIFDSNIPIFPKVLPQTLDIEYSVLDREIPKTFNFDIVITSLNFQFQFPLEKGDTLKLPVLVNIFNSNDIPSSFDENEYHALKVKWSFNRFENGVCYCIEQQFCTCEKITLMIFFNGKIIVSGSKNYFMVKIIHKSVLEFLKTDFIQENAVLKRNYLDLFNKKINNGKKLNLLSLIKEIQVDK
jgi:TATA-box binding protein (TBP) (component of TFIID and TFIIIB)